MGNAAAYHHSGENVPGSGTERTSSSATKVSRLPHTGPLLTVLTASRWYTSKGIPCGLTRHRKGHWEITPRTGAGVAAGARED